MNITIDIRCLMSPNYSGVAQYTFNLLDNIFKIDQQNNYKLFYNSNQDIAANLPKFNYPNIKFYGFKYPNKLINSSFLSLNYPKIDKMIGGCDLFWLPNLNFCAFSQITKKILTIHDLSFELFPHFFSLKQRLWHKLLKPRQLAQTSAKIIVDSNQTKTDLINFYKLGSDKIKVIHLGLDHDKFLQLDKNNSTLPESVKAKYNLPDKFLLYLGTLEPRKNIEGIISAFSQLKQRPNFSELSLVIAGAAGWKTKRIFQASQASAFADQIHFLGYVSEADKTCLYNLAAIFIFPSFYEGFGLPAIEAQACGTPVIASANSSFPEILADSALLIDPDNTAQIALAISQILSDHQLKQELIAKGLINSQRFSWTTCARETLDYLIS